jgi:hypothetical protein
MYAKLTSTGCGCERDACQQGCCSGCACGCCGNAPQCRGCPDGEDGPYLGDWKQKCCWYLRCAHSLVLVPFVQGVFFTVGYFVCKYRLVPWLFPRLLPASTP